MNRNINWHSGNGIQHTTPPDSRFLTSQIWMNDLENDIQGTGVEIIELNTSDNSQTSNEDTPDPQYTSHPWSYATMLNNSEDICKANRQARLRRRLRNRNRFPENGAHDNEFDSSFYFDNIGTRDTADVKAFNQTCMTILDKLSALELDSSFEDFQEPDTEARCEVMSEAAWKGKEDSSEELVTYNSDLDGEKHTIWIYSFKNRRILSDIDFETVNIPSREGVASVSPPEIDEELNTSKTRVPSPVPATHIPRLNLSLGATLPNVTEVTEPKSSESLIQNLVPITQKLANNWCSDRSEKATITENKVTNIVNWMALSPRERRRHYRHSCQAPIQLQPVTEASQDDKKEVREQIETVKSEPAALQTEKPNLDICDMETADETKFSKAPSQINSQRSWTNSKRERFPNNLDICEIETADETKLSKAPSQINSERSWTNSKRERFPNNATYLISPLPGRVNLDLSYKTEHESEITKLRNAVRGALSDRGSYKVKRPRITIDNSFLLSPITKPIENLDSSDWIAVHEPKAWHQGRRQVMSAGDRLMIRNMALLKPAEWKSYSPVTGSKLSIHLECDMEPKKTFFQRCINCFKCCK